MSLHFACYLSTSAALHQKEIKLIKISVAEKKTSFKRARRERSYIRSFYLLGHGALNIFQFSLNSQTGSNLLGMTQLHTKKLQLKKKASADKYKTIFCARSRSYFEKQSHVRLRDLLRSKDDLNNNNNSRGVETLRRNENDHMNS